MRKLGLSCNSCEKKYGLFAARPVVFVGETRSAKMIRALNQLGWGRLFAFQKKINAKTLWALDNGAYHAWKHGKPFPAQSFRERLDAAFSVGTPYFAVAPDLVAEGLRSLEFTMEWLPKLPQEWPWMLAVQDGMTEDDIEPHLHHFAGLFLGGSDQFKSTAKDWCGFAHRHGKRFHYARCGTVKKMFEAQRIGADSLDSAFPLWTAARFDRFAKVWRVGDGQMELGIHPGR